MSGLQPNYVISWLESRETSIKEEFRNFKAGETSIDKGGSLKKEGNEIDPDIAALSSEGSEDEEEEVPIVKNRQSRSSVSAEAYGSFNVKGAFVPKNIPKTKEQINRIKGLLSAQFMFSNLDSNAFGTIIMAMEEQRFKYTFFEGKTQ